MKYYNVKITEEEKKRLCEILGITSGNFNLTSGIFRVTSKEAVNMLAEKFNIDNVNWSSYEEFKNGATISHRKNHNSAEDSCIEDVETERPSSYEWTLEERCKFIGNNPKVGSIVRIKKESETIHVLITKIASDGTHTGYKMILGTTGYSPEMGDIILEKYKDVVYRNLTYKAKVIVSTEEITQIKRKNFLFAAGGLVVGRILNDEVLKQILKRENKELEIETEAETPEIKELHVEETNESIFEDQVETKTGEEATTVAEKEGNMLKENSFEEYVKGVSSAEELIDKMNLNGTVLSSAIRICVHNKSSNMKKLLPILQKQYSEKKMTQNSFKNQMNNEMTKWCEKSKYFLKEETVSYFLRVIVKEMNC